MKELRGRNALLTGASRGLGVHIARALAREGVNLVLAARSADRLARVRDDAVSRGVRAVTVRADLGEAADVGRLPEEAERRLGPVDILVNNAGVQFTAPYEEYPPGKVALAVNVNLLAPMLLTRALLPGMLARGVGHIVNMSSLAGKIGLPSSVPYGTTKAGLIMFTQSLRTELLDTAVGASVICPGFVAGDGKYARAAASAVKVPRRIRTTTPEKVAHAVVRAIRRNTAEVVVNPPPTRPFLVLKEVAPWILPHLHKVLGTTALARAIAEEDPDQG